MGRSEVCAEGECLEFCGFELDFVFFCFVYCEVGGGIWEFRRFVGEVC